jgi:hypothetical protein
LCAWSVGRLGGVAVFRGHIRRSGSLRSVWHKRERKRRPLDPRLAATLAEPTPSPVRYRYTPTEAEWLGGNPDAMLRCLVRLTSDRRVVFHLPRLAVQRKLRLFYCACCRLRWDLLPPAGREAVGAIERYADGLAGAKQLRAARRAAEAVSRELRPAWAGGYAPGAWDATSTADLAVTAAEVHGRLRSGSVPNGLPAGAAAQALLLGDLFGNPFRPVEVPAAWRTPTVVSLARAIHNERAFGLMPVLGDALQDAGCAHPEVLAHCYGPGPHAPGCWLLDGLTGRDSA